MPGQVNAILTLPRSSPQQKQLVGTVPGQVYPILTLQLLLNIFVRNGPPRGSVAGTMLPLQLHVKICVRSGLARGSARRHQPNAATEKEPLAV